MRKPTLSVRDSMTALPAFLQTYFTWQTGMAHTGQQPTFRWSPWGRLAVHTVQLVAGVGASLVGLALGGGALALLPLGWFLTSASQRTLYLAILHNAIHDAFSPIRRVNRIVAEIVSTLLLVNGYDRFRRDHARWHHGKQLATQEDPDAQFLRTFGFGPGITRRQAWRTFWRTAFNPRFHALYLKQRLVTNFVEAPPYRIAMAVVWHAGLLTVVAISGAWVPFLLAWFVPLTILYHLSSLAQMMSEHHWELPEDERGPANVNLTFGRHLGDRYPGRDAPLSQRTRWWARLLLVHLPARVWILVGPDLHVHDYHHRHARGDWANATYVRAEDAPQYDGTDRAYVSVWGSYADHMNVVFDRWARSADEGGTD